jgi:hypothetical protein
MGLPFPIHCQCRTCAPLSYPFLPSRPSPLCPHPPLSSHSLPLRKYLAISLGPIFTSPGIQGPSFLLPQLPFFCALCFLSSTPYDLAGLFRGHYVPIILSQSPNRRLWFFPLQVSCFIFLGLSSGITIISWSS